ncbi:MAG: hypothetical protein U0791_26190 [Gemmataceae bacterium]
MERAIAAAADVNGHGRRVVPPQFLGHGSEEMERFAQSVEHGFSAFGGKRDGERRVRITPRDDENGHEPATIREVDVNVAEIGFAAVPRRMVKRDERLAP